MTLPGLAVPCLRLRFADSIYHWHWLPSCPHRALDFYQRMKLVNYLRSQVAALDGGRCELGGDGGPGATLALFGADGAVVVAALAKTSLEWQADSFMQPVRLRATAEAARAPILLQ